MSITTSIDRNTVDKNTENFVDVESLKRSAPDKYKTILADPPWRFANRNANMSPESNNCFRYPTLNLDQIVNMPIKDISDAQGCHLYLWVPNALLLDGIKVMQSWGFQYKTSLIWEKITKDGLPDRSGFGFYFRNAFEILLFGIRGKLRTSQEGRSQANVIRERKTKHSKKPLSQYELIELASPSPYVELFARTKHPGWAHWGNEI